jgi:FhuF 2Fe-2S C-terminal domain
MHSGSVVAALADAARLGPYFTITAGEIDGNWCRAREMHADGWRDRIGTVGRRLGTDEVRVAISTVQLDFAARAWSPVLACALLHGVVVDLDDLHISVAGPVTLMLPEPRGLPASGTDQAAMLYRTVMEHHLQPFSAGLHGNTGLQGDTGSGGNEEPQGAVADGMLWGNAASAMLAALRIVVNSRPDLNQAARELAEQLLDTGLLRGTGYLSTTGLRFRRRSCCLFYRVPGGGTCSDCSLLRDPP